MKTFDKKDVFSWANCEEAKKYIGKLGFYSNNFPTLEVNVKNCEPKELIAVNDYGIGCFNFNSTASGYGLFLPLDKVKEVKEEKKWRAFKSVKEFVDTTGLDIGQCVFIRKTKGEFAKQWTTKALITAITDYVGDTPSISFGNDCWSVDELADMYEYSRDTTRWYPFGVEE